MGEPAPHQPLEPARRELARRFLGVGAGGSSRALSSAFGIIGEAGSVLTPTDFDPMRPIGGVSLVRMSVVSTAVPAMGACTTAIEDLGSMRAMRADVAAGPHIPITTKKRAPAAVAHPKPIIMARREIVLQGSRLTLRRRLRWAS
jgi:hypothetical protein